MTDLQPAPASPLQGLGRRLLVGVLFGVAVVVVVMLLSDAGALAASARAFDGRVLVVALGLVLVGYGVRVVKWQIYLWRLGISLPWGESALTFVAGMVMGVTPGKVGEVLKSFLLKDAHGIPIARTAPIVLAERLTDLIALLALASVAIGTGTYGLGVLLAGAVLTAAVLLAFVWPPARRLMLAVAARTPLLRRVVGKLEEATEAMVRLVGLKTLAATSALSVVAWGAESVAAWVVFGGFEGVEVSLGAATFVFAFASVAGALSMLPGGLLAAEGSMVALLHEVFRLTPTAEVAAAATLVVRFCTLWFGVLLGGLALVAVRRLRARTR